MTAFGNAHAFLDVPITACAAWLERKLRLVVKAERLRGDASLAPRQQLIPRPGWWLRSYAVASHASIISATARVRVRSIGVNGSMALDVGWNSKLAPL